MKSKRRGFTVLELIVSITITVIVLGIVFTVFIWGEKIFTDVDVKSTLQEEAQISEEKINNIGMQASEIEEDLVLGKLIKSYNKDGLVGYFKFEKVGRELYIIQYSKEKDSFTYEKEDVIAENVENFDEKYYDSFAEFNIKFSQKKGFSNVEYSIPINVTFRNEGIN